MLLVPGVVPQIWQSNKDDWCHVKSFGQCMVFHLQILENDKDSIGAWWWQGSTAHLEWLWVWQVGRLGEITGSEFWLTKQFQAWTFMISASITLHLCAVGCGTVHRPWKVMQTWLQGKPRKCMGFPMFWTNRTWLQLIGIVHFFLTQVSLISRVKQMHGVCCRVIKARVCSKN